MRPGRVTRSGVRPRRQVKVRRGITPGWVAPPLIELPGVADHHPTVGKPPRKRRSPSWARLTAHVQVVDPVPCTDAAVLAIMPYWGRRTGVPGAALSRLITRARGTEHEDRRQEAPDDQRDHVEGRGPHGVVGPHAQVEVEDRPQKPVDRAYHRWMAAQTTPSTAPRSTSSSQSHPMTDWDTTPNIRPTRGSRMSISRRYQSEGSITAKGSRPWTSRGMRRSRSLR